MHQDLAEYFSNELPPVIPHDTYFPEILFAQQPHLLKKMSMCGNAECNHKFRIAEGVAWRMHFETEDGVYYGVVPFCNLLCLLTAVPVEGEC